MAWPGLVGARSLVALAAAASAPLPEIRRPVPFDTPAADHLLQALTVFPPDNPWNADISAWPVHPNSRAIIDSVGAAKPLRCNPDMGFILVPPDQERVPVWITEYRERD